jgi:hypothetical protein
VHFVERGESENDGALNCYAENGKDGGSEEKGERRAIKE